jgi:hypothetical protein
MIRLMRLAIGHALRRKAMSLAAIATSAVVAAAVVTLTGDAARQANALLSSLRDPHSRSVVIRSTNPSKPIVGSTARAIASLPGVELAVAFPPAQSVTAPGLHDPNASAGFLALDTLHGNPPIRFTRGRPPAAHEVAVSPGAIAALRITQPLATGIAVADEQVPIVGTFVVDDRGVISDLLANAVVGPAEVTDGYGIVAFLAREPADVATIVSTANLLLTDRNNLTVDYERRAAEIERTVATAGRRNLASIAFSIVLVGALIQLASSLLTAVLQRRENARRRALGFTRYEIIGLGAMQAAILSALGAALGTAAAWARLDAHGAHVQLAQPAATIGLLIILAILASLPGGTAAALQDPARILRVP